MSNADVDVTPAKASLGTAGYVKVDGDKFTTVSTIPSSDIEGGGSGSVHGTLTELGETEVGFSISGEGDYKQTLTPDFLQSLTDEEITKVIFTTRLETTTGAVNAHGLTVTFTNSTAGRRITVAVSCDATIKATWTVSVTAFLWTY